MRPEYYLHQIMTIRPSTTQTVAALKAAPYNPRKISTDQLKRLAKAMSEFGDLSGIGHIETPWGRWTYREVDWSEKKERAANVAANQHGGEWDIPALKDILVDLDDGAFDLDLTGFGEADLQSLINWEGKQGLTDQDDVPPIPQKIITQRGDIWVLGEHRVMCSDSTQGLNVSKTLQSRRPTLIFADPPYGVSIGAKNRMLNSFQPSGRNLTDIKSDSLSPEHLKLQLLPAFVLIHDVMADDCTICVTAPQCGELGMMMMEEAGLRVRHVLIWKKNAPTFSMGRLDYDYQHEPILLTWGKRHKRPMAGPHKTSVWEIPKPRANKDHPTMKPVEIILNAILNHSDIGDTIYDPFCGSGSTVIACERTGRRCRHPCGLCARGC